MIIRCNSCCADPIGRWKQPPAMIFVDQHDGRHYACRIHLSEKREVEIQEREKDRGLPQGSLR